jgi:choline kinase
VRGLARAPGRRPGLMGDLTGDGRKFGRLLRSCECRSAAVRHGIEESVIAIRRAVVLAAGRGTRLGALTAETPKCLLRIDGRAMLDWQLEAFAGAGIEDVTVVAGFMAEAIVRHVAGRCRVVVNEQYVTTDSIHSLALAAPHLRGDGFFLQNGDTLYSTALLRRMVAAPHENSCLVDSDRPYRAGEYHVETADGRVARYCKDVAAERSVGESAQLLRVGAGDSDAFLDRIENLARADGARGFPNQAYDVLMRGSGLWPVFTAGLPWWEVDTAEDLAACDADHGARSGTVSSVGVARQARFSKETPLTLSRVVRFVARPQLGWRFRWVRPTIGPMFQRPARVARELKAFRTGQLSLNGLDLAVNGARFLRLVLAEARGVGLQPFLLWGTLLGCVRSGGFIRGDSDIDLGVMASDAGRLPELRERLQGRAFRVRIENEEKLSLVHPRHPFLFVDIDVVRPHREGWAIVNRDTDAERVFRYHFPAGVFAGVQSATFGGDLMVQIPGDAEGFLAGVYNDWRKPAGKVDFRYGPLNVEVERVWRVDQHALMSQ